MSAQNSAAMATATRSDREIVFTRVFDAPRELVWKAWTEREHVERWWGPNGFSTTTEMMDVKPGGMWVHTMHGPDKKNYPNKQVYREVVKPERLVYLHRGGRKNELQVNFETTGTFEEQGSKTKLTMRMLFASAEARDLVAKTYGAVEGGNQTLGRLAEFLPTLTAQTVVAVGNRGEKTVLIAEPGKPTTILSRVFDAPRRLVYEAYTNPNHIEKWWGRRRLKTVVDKLDVRPGGMWRFVQHGADGEKFAFSGEFREVVPGERIVSTFEFEAMPGHVILNTALFEEYEGKTKVTISAIYQSVEDREGMLRAGMEIGANEAWDMLDELLTGHGDRVDAEPGTAGSVRGERLM